MPSTAQPETMVTENCERDGAAVVLRHGKCSLQAPALGAHTTKAGACQNFCFGPSWT